MTQMLCSNVRTVKCQLYGILFRVMTRFEGNQWHHPIISININISDCLYIENLYVAATKFLNDLYTVKYLI